MFLMDFGGGVYNRGDSWIWTPSMKSVWCLLPPSAEIENECLCSVLALRPKVPLRLLALSIRPSSVALALMIGAVRYRQTRQSVGPTAVW